MFNKYPTDQRSGDFGRGLKRFIPYSFLVFVTVLLLIIAGDFGVRPQDSEIHFQNAQLDSAE